MSRFGIGDIIMFNYELGHKVNTKEPTVLVLHDNWLCHTPRDSLLRAGRLPPGNGRCLHGLNWGKLDHDEQTYLRAVMNPMLALKLSQKDQAFADKMEEIDQLTGLEIHSPHDFYIRLIRPFIRPKAWEPYRRYRLDKMRGSFVVEDSMVLSGAKTDTTYAKITRRMKILRGPRF